METDSGFFFTLKLRHRYDAGARVQPSFQDCPSSVGPWGHSGGETGRFPSIWSWSDWKLEEDSVEIRSANSTWMSLRSTGTRERFTRDAGS